MLPHIEQFLVSLSGIVAQRVSPLESCARTCREQRSIGCLRPLPQFGRRAFALTKYGASVACQAPYSCMSTRVTGKQSLTSSARYICPLRHKKGCDIAVAGGTLPHTLGECSLG
eukprot:3826059-Amphidinium_carterae.1